MRNYFRGTMNEMQTKRVVNWQFKTADARIKLKNLYPILNL